jgi:hypothetical protein
VDKLRDYRQRGGKEERQNVGFALILLQFRVAENVFREAVSIQAGRRRVMSLDWRILELEWSGVKWSAKPYKARLKP